MNGSEDNGRESLNWTDVPEDSITNMLENANFDIDFFAIIGSLTDILGSGIIKNILGATSLGSIFKR